jgi:hypothetical protein
MRLSPAVPIAMLTFAAASAVAAKVATPRVSSSGKVAGREVRFVTAYYRPSTKTQEFASLVLASEQLTCEEINHSSMSRKHVDVLAFELMTREEEEGERDRPPERPGVFPVHDPRDEEAPEGNRSTVAYLRSGDHCEWAEPTPILGDKGKVSVKSMRPMSITFDVTLRNGDRLKGTAQAVTCPPLTSQPAPATSCK